ncbi:protein kinase [Rhizoctonia solani]|uniref:Protein kinase n=1 Tax=Rhizoctonia solani TaxID=456999 RepID=A0A8H7IGP1_9AGAM|nr:protein kinase [Rhizoctonia solani]
MHNPRVLSLRIDTNVRPSLHLPSGSLQDTPWRTPVTPGSPALFSPTNTSASTQTPVTPASRAPWFPIGGNAGSPGSCDIDILKYPNVVHAGEPRDHGAFASIERLGGSLRGLLMSKPSQSKDSQLSKTTAMVIESNLSDWSVVEEVLKEALATATNTNCVLKGIIRKVKFLADLEQVICSPRTELVAADRLIAVLATSIHDFPHRENRRLKELWNKLCVQRTLDRTPIHPEDAIYGTVPLIDTVRGTSIENSTVPTPYYEPRVPPSSPHPENRPDGQVQTRDDSVHPAIQQTVPRMLSVVDNYPFAKGYTNDIGPDIDIDSLEPHPFARGAFGDVRRGSLRDGTPVAIKCLRFYTQAQLLKSLKEIRVWSFLNHENVLPLLGLCVVNNELGMVSSSCRTEPYKSIYATIQVWIGISCQAIYVCAGLVYLHEHPNTLYTVTSKHGRKWIPKLTDFGLAQMIRAEDSTERSSSSCVGGTSRWMAPELIGSGSPSASCGSLNLQVTFMHWEW